MHFPYSRTWIDTTKTSFPSSSVRSQMEPSNSVGSQPRALETEMSLYHSSYVDSHTQRPTLSLPPPEQPPNQFQRGPSMVCNSQTFPAFNPSSSTSAVLTPRTFQILQEYQPRVRESGDSPTTSQSGYQTQQPSLRTKSTPLRTISQPSQTAASDMHNRLPSHYFIAIPTGPPRPHLRSMEEYQRWLDMSNGSTVPRAQSRSQQTSALSYSSPHSPIMPRQPNQRPSSDVRNAPSIPGLQNVAGVMSSQPRKSVFMKSAIPAHPKPLQQSFLEINQILSSVTETMELAKAELITLKSNGSIKAPGLAGRGTRLAIIHAQAKIAGCEYFLAELSKSVPHNSQRGVEGLASPETKYQLQLSVNLMLIGIETEDLIKFSLAQLRKVKQDLAIRINNVAVASRQIQIRHEKETVDTYKAWTVEVAELAARAFFLQRCLDGLGRRFLSWEEKAQIEEKALPPSEPAGSRHDFQPQNLEGAGTYQGL